MKPNMFGYKVTIETNQDHYEHDGEQWGSWSASSSHELNKLVQKTTEHPDVASKLDIPSGTQAILVWVVWSSGDSFGHEDGAYSEAVGLFTDIKAATELQKHIESQNWNDNHELNFSTSDGQDFHIGFAGWAGYFESIDSVHVDVVSVF